MKNRGPLRMTGRMARALLKGLPSRILIEMHKGGKWAETGATLHEMAEHFGVTNDVASKGIEHLRNRRDIVPSDGDRRAGAPRRVVVYRILPKGRERLERLLKADAREPQDPVLPVWLKRKEKERKEPCAPRVLKTQPEGRCLAGPQGESHRDEPVSEYRGGVHLRGDGMDDFRSMYPSVLCGIDESREPLENTPWKGQVKRLKRRLRWQLSATRPDMEDRLRWAAASRVLGVRVEDLRKLGI